MTDKKTIASYAENAGKATKAISAEVAARCTGNAETATAFKDAHEIIFSGDAEATAKFDGAADLVIDVKNKNSEKAKCDEFGNNIFETYATKEELEKYALIEAVASICVSRKELVDYVAKEEFNFTFEKFNGVPCLFIEVDGKKYKFSGVEV